MRVKVFTGDASRIESQINDWLEQTDIAAITKTEMAVAAVAGKPNDGAHPYIVMTIWYEPTKTSSVSARRLRL